MRKVLRQILEGNFTSDCSALDFSCTMIELNVAAGEVVEGSFHIYAGKGAATEGQVTSTDARMECISYGLTGSDTEVCYCFHGDLCREGDVVKGSFCIVSNHGEYFIPFVIHVERVTLDSSVGPIRNLFHFTNLAKSSWQEAVRLFYSPEFTTIFSGSDAAFLGTYHALSGRTGNQQNVEEFLININKKQRLEYVCHTQELNMSLAGASTGISVYEKELEILRNGWGYTYLKVECEGDFLFTEHQTLSDDDFLGNVCNLKVFVDMSRCRNGVYHGKIKLTNAFQSLEIPVQVTGGMANPYRGKERNRKILLSGIVRNFLDFRSGKMGQEVFLKETNSLVEQFISNDEKDQLGRLFQAHLFLLQDRINEASWVLDQAGGELEQIAASRQREPEDFSLCICYHWYLASILKKDDETVALNAASEVERIFKANRNDWRILWILLYLPNRYTENVQNAWNLMEKQYEYGTGSPVLYLEGLKRLNENPTLARSLTGYTLHVVHYGAREGLIRAEVIDQIVYLCGRQKEYSRLLTHALTELYRTYPEKRILQEICSQMIKGAKRDAIAAEWYRLGVEAEIKLTNLYEFYVSSLDISVLQDIPKIVLLYFSYQNNLDYEHMAYLYHYIISHKREMEEIYNNNYSAMERFAQEQIQRGRMSLHLAAVYEEVLTPSLMNKAIAVRLADLLFSGWLRSDYKNGVTLYVYQKDFTRPLRYDLKEGCGWFSAVDRDCMLCVEDVDGNRFVQTMDSGVERFSLSSRFLTKVSEYVWDNTILNYYLCKSEWGAVEPNQENVYRFLQLAASEDLEREVRNTFRLMALRFYFEKDDKKNFAELLHSLQPEDYDPTEKAEIFRYMVSAREDALALEWLRDYQPYFADPKYLQILLDRVLTSENLCPEPILDNAAAFAFRNGRVDSALTGYLAGRHHGLIRDLRDLWKTAVSFGLNTLALEERILLQILYSGSFVGEQYHIFLHYAENGGDIKIVQAFLTQCCFDYFVGQKLIPDEVIELTEVLFGQEIELHRVCKLAYLQSLVENGTMPERQKRDTVLAFLKELMGEHIHLGFFRDFLRENLFPPGEQRNILEEVLAELADKTIVDYRTTPGCVAKIHYLSSGDRLSGQDYVAEYMRDVCGGVCFAEFVLFFGESVQYYITEERGTESTLTQSGDLQCTETQDGNRFSRFNMINDMLVSNSLQDYGTFDHLTEEYYRRDFYNSQLFTLK